MSGPGPSPDGTRRFGDYELLRYFTAGGMADLYLARNPRFGDRQLILKRIQSRYLDHTRVVKMFIDEGRIAGVLEHPNIVRVLDVGQESGAWYIAMEYIHGHDLVAIARRSVEAGVRIPRGVVVGALSQVAAGLDYAHSRSDESGRPLRIVHCDVSPGNVVISFRGVAKVVDFGIARATIALRVEDGVAGKYNYMAPEQVRGEPFDARADLFPLGVMLHELTVGRRLFRGRPEQVMRKVCEEPIPLPSDLVSGYPQALEKIIMRLLERDPAARYPTAGAAHAELRTYLEQEEAGGYGKGEIARFLKTLFAAPRSDTSDPSVVVEDMEVDRGMPESAESEESAATGHHDDDEEAPEIARPAAPLAPAPQPIAPAVQPAAPAPTRKPRAARPANPINDGPTAAITLPVTEVRRARLPIERTELVRSPEARRVRNPRRPSPDDPTKLLETPEARRRKRKKPVYLSTSVVVGGCMILLAALLLIIWIATSR